jgi:hypothetical protein
MDPRMQKDLQLIQSILNEVRLIEQIEVESIPGPQDKIMIGYGEIYWAKKPDSIKITITAITKEQTVGKDGMVCPDFPDSKDFSHLRKLL